MSFSRVERNSLHERVWILPSSAENESALLSGHCNAREPESSQGRLRTGKTVLTTEFSAFARTEGAKVLDAVTSMRCRDVRFGVGSKFFPINRTIVIPCGWDVLPIEPASPLVATFAAIGRFSNSSRTGKLSVQILVRFTLYPAILRHCSFACGGGFRSIHEGFL